MKTLSDEIIECYGYDRIDCIKVKKVKGFIKKLREGYYDLLSADHHLHDFLYALNKKLDALAGRKLTKADMEIS